MPRLRIVNAIHIKLVSKVDKSTYSITPNRSDVSFILVFKYSYNFQNLGCRDNFWFNENNDFLTHLVKQHINVNHESWTTSTNRKCCLMRVWIFIVRYNQVPFTTDSLVQQISWNVLRICCFMILILDKD